MDKSREDFEDYFEDSYGWEAGDYPNQTYVTEVWNMWQASRKALVVELPGKISQQNMFNGRALPEAESYDEAIEDCADAIRDVGITVKGDE